MITTKSLLFRFLFLLALPAFVLTACEKDDYLTSSELQDAPVELRDHTANAYFSSNTAGQIGILAPNNQTLQRVGVPYTDADGIDYMPSMGILYQANRSGNRLALYAADDLQGNAALPLASGPAGRFSNAREIAVSGDMIVVADDGSNNLVVFRNTGGNISWVKTIGTTINLWGIEFDGNSLYAVEDNSSRIAIFNNFLDNPNGVTIRPDVSVDVGIVRTHGIEYNATADVMVLTDVGDGGNADDGAFHFVSNWSYKLGLAARSRAARFDNGTLMISIPASQQIRVAGSNTFLGNPVDVDYRMATGQIYIAERANGGGRILVFNTPGSSGNMAPVSNIMFAGASAVDLGM